MVAFRTHISCSALIVIVLLLTVFAVLIHTGLSQLIHRHIDDELLTLAQEEARRVEVKTGILSSSDDDDEHELREAARFTTILDSSGAVLWKGAAVSLQSALDPSFLAEVKEGRTVFDTISIPNSDPMRRISFPIFSGGTVQYILQTETSLRLVQDTLRLLIILLAGLAVAMAAIAWAGSRWIARQALTPIEVLTTTAEQISIPSPKARMELDAPYEEFGRLARVFNAMLDRLHKVFEGQRRFIADAAHEMQTPLAVMKSAIEVGLQKSRTAEEYRDLLVTNLGQVERLSGLTRSLLTLAQFSSEHPPVKLVPLPIEPLLQSLVKDLTVLADDRKIQFLLDTHPVPLILGDEGKLTQLLINLLDNALAHTSAGGRVVIRLQDKSGQVELAVEDTGSGIAPEHLPRLFERFYRADPSRDRESGGAGLGLAIVKEIAEAHGGSVRVESTVGKGTIFTVSLPPYQSAETIGG